MSLTTAIFLDNRRLKEKSRTFPIKLRVTYHRASKEYQTVYDLSEEDFNKLEASNISKPLQKVRDGLKTIRSEVGAIVKQDDNFSFEEFKRDYITGHAQFKQRKSKPAPVPEANPSQFDFSEYYKRFPILLEDHSEPGTISGVFCHIIKQLISETRLGSAFKYRDSYSSLKKFGGNARFVDISVSYLRRYEGWMLAQNRSKTTVGMTLRNLRTVFNEADHQGIINKQKCYPFGRRKYQIPTSKKVKKALSMEDIGRVYYYQTTCDNEEYAKCLWLFCYFGNGMNPKDLAYLKYKNIQGEYLTFDRAKTELTARNDPKTITVYINEDMRAIIERWGNKNHDANNYIFPIMQPSLTALEEYRSVTRTTALINDWLDKIGNKLGIELKLTTIVTRHSFSTRLKRAGISTEFIQEALGHTDIRTTENYLGSFENEVKKAFAGKLTEFKKEPPLKAV